MNIEVGKIYVDRFGDKVEIVFIDESMEQPYVGKKVSNGEGYWVHYPKFHTLVEHKEPKRIKVYLKKHTSDKSPNPFMWVTNAGYSGDAEQTLLGTAWVTEGEWAEPGDKPA